MTLAITACGTRTASEDRSPLEAAAVEVAIAASVGEGILVGDARAVDAAAMTLAEAENMLTDWGAVFAEFPDYPPPDTPVWVVEILGEGIERGPPGTDNAKRCLDIRVIVLEKQQEELVLFGKPSEDC